MGMSFIAFMCDVGFNWAAYEMSAPASYVALCFALELAAALVIGTIASALHWRISTTLALWAGLYGLMLRGVPCGAALALVTWLAMRFDLRQREAPFGSGTVVGFAMVIVIIGTPRLLRLAKLSIASDNVMLVVEIALFAAAIFACGRYCQLRQALPRIPRVSTAVFTATLASVLLLSVGVRSSGYDPEPWLQLDYGSSPKASNASRPHILVLILDTVRADHLSIYGYHRDTTPALADFMERSKRAALYPYSFSTSPWTLPAHASLFAGTIPSIHGVHNGGRRLAEANREEGSGAAGKNLIRMTLKSKDTLAGVLRKHGYRTAGIFANEGVSSVAGLTEGFDVFVEPAYPRAFWLLSEKLRWWFVSGYFDVLQRPSPTAEQINRAVLAYFDHCAPGPCFVVANYMEAHSPYVPNSPHADRYSGGTMRNPPKLSRAEDPREVNQYAEARYDEEIRSLDSQLGRLLAELEERGILGRTWLVITSDHGEAFQEHGVTAHPAGAYNHQVRIPLLIQPPDGIELMARNEPVSLIDVTATLSLIGGAEKLGDGRDLRGEQFDEAPVYIEYFGSLRKDLQHGKLAVVPSRAVVVGRSKLIQREGEYEYYDLVSDPKEQNNLHHADGDRAALLSKLLPPLHAESALPDPRSEPPATLSDDEMETLRALGYIE